MQRQIRDGTLEWEFMDTFSQFYSKMESHNKELYQIFLTHQAWEYVPNYYIKMNITLPFNDTVPAQFYPIINLITNNPCDTVGVLDGGNIHYKKYLKYKTKYKNYKKLNNLD